MNPCRKRQGFIIVHNREVICVEQYKTVFTICKAVQMEDYIYDSNWYY
jgi:hypothetical protein